MKSKHRVIADTEETLRPSNSGMAAAALMWGSSSDVSRGLHQADDDMIDSQDHHRGCQEATSTIQG